jgi:hypothetical protein
VAEATEAGKVRVPVVSSVKTTLAQVEEDVLTLGAGGPSPQRGRLPRGHAISNPPSHPRGFLSEVDR